MVKTNYGIEMTIEEIKSYLCFYDKRHPDFTLTEWDVDDMNNYGNFPQKKCSCDNCFYSKAKLAEELLLLYSKLNSLNEKL